MSDFIIIISGIGFIQSILFLLLISQKKHKQSSDWVLLTWFLLFAIHLGLIILIHLTDSQFGVVLAKTFGLLHGPFLLFYTLSLFNKIEFKKSAIHLIPFVVFSITAFFVNKETLDYWEIGLLVSKTISLLVYPIFIGIWMKKQLNQIKKSRADSFILDAKWLNSLVAILMLYASIGILHVLMDVLFNIEFSILLDIFVFVSMITIIGFYGLKFKVVYESDIIDSKSSLPEYKNSPLKKENTSRLKGKIDTFFNSSEDYLNPQFSLTELSEKLNIPKHHLSEIINQEMKTTFYDIVNKKRIQYAMKRISEQSESNITLEGLGYESGYNSKSSFFHHFKKYTEKTPRQYKLEISSN